MKSEKCMSGKGLSTLPSAVDMMKTERLSLETWRPLTILVGAITTSLGKQILTLSGIIIADYYVFTISMTKFQ